MFNLDALPSWEPLLPKENIIIQAEQPRRCRLSFNVNGPAEVWATYQVAPDFQTPDGVLVKASDPETRDVLIGSAQCGLIEVNFTTFGETIVRVLADDDTVIFVRHFTADQRVPESDDPAYTTPFPRERRNTEFDRMLLWAKLNEQRREAQFREALARLQPAAQAGETSGQAGDPPAQDANAAAQAQPQNGGDGNA